MATPKRVALALLIAAAPAESGFLRVTTVASNANSSGNGSGPVKAPEQGYSGKTVHHENMSTSTGDWGKEGGWDEKKEKKIQQAQTHFVAIAANSTNASGNGSGPAKAPEQGYHGETVHHADTETSTGDWGKEGGWDEEKERKIQQAQKQLLSKTHVVTIASNSSNGSNGPAKAPEQGYHGETVHHADTATSTGDWGKEGGWDEEKERKIQKAQTHLVAITSHRNNSGNGSGPVKAPEQGYSGKTVHHENMSTSTGDWGKEGGWDEKKEKKIQQAQTHLVEIVSHRNDSSNGSGPVKAPEQGYSGKTVHHENMSTSTGDWGKEGGWDEKKEKKIQQQLLQVELLKEEAQRDEKNESGQVKAPEQGYSGATVHHANMSTSTGDWGTEGGWNEEKEIKLQEAQKNTATRKQIQSKSQAEADAEAQEATDAEDEAKLKAAEAKAEQKAKAKAKAEAKAKKEKEEKEKKEERSFGSRAASATLAFALPAAAVLLAAIVQ